MVIYLAGPYSSDNPEITEAYVDMATQVTHMLQRAGYAVICPHMLYTQDSHLSYENVMEQCLDLLEICDYIIRLPGKSRGADLEVLVAKKLGLTLPPNSLAEIPLILEKADKIYLSIIEKYYTPGKN